MDGEFGAFVVDDSGGMDNGMTGVSMAGNLQSAQRIAPSRSLVYLWIVCLAAYWLLGYMFKSKR